MFVQRRLAFQANPDRRIRRGFAFQAATRQCAENVVTAGQQCIHPYIQRSRLLQALAQYPDLRFIHIGRQLVDHPLRHFDFDRQRPVFAITLHLFQLLRLLRTAQLFQLTQADAAKTVQISQQQQACIGVVTQHLAQRQQVAQYTEYAFGDKMPVTRTQLAPFAEKMAKHRISRLAEWQHLLQSGFSSGNLGVL